MTVTRMTTGNRSSARCPTMSTVRSTNREIFDRDREYGVRDVRSFSSLCCRKNHATSNAASRRRHNAESHLPIIISGCPVIRLILRIRLPMGGVTPAIQSPAKARRWHRPTQHNCRPDVFFRFFPCILRSVGPTRDSGRSRRRQPVTNYPPFDWGVRDSLTRMATALVGLRSGQPFAFFAD